jgi:hypothetical protein
MKKISLMVDILVLLLVMSLGLGLPQVQAEQTWEETQTDLVARISLIEGQLERFDPAENAWVVAAVDEPVGIDDQLFATAGTRAEILIPNNTVLRIGAQTQVQLIALTDRLTEVALSYGKARIYSRAGQAEFIAGTPFGRVTVPPGNTVDVYLDDQQVEIFALQGRAYFTNDIKGEQREIAAGPIALVADANRTVLASGSVDRAWHAWNYDQEALWAQRERTTGESEKFLPPPLQRDAYVLDANGTWQSVYYEGAYYRFWRPLHVGTGWAPFTAGAWMVWRGDRVWVSHEPFGYITHHYGNWIYTQGYWYWAPPVTGVMVRAGLPLLHIGLGWYPGRVAWISAGIQVGWVPLAPFEPYYCHYHWGRRSVVVAKGFYPYRPASRPYQFHQHVVMVHRDRAFQHIVVGPVAQRPIHLRPLPLPEPTRFPRSPKQSFSSVAEAKSKTAPAPNRIQRLEPIRVSREHDAPQPPARPSSRVVPPMTSGKAPAMGVSPNSNDRMRPQVQPRGEIDRLRRPATIQPLEAKPNPGPDRIHQAPSRFGSVAPQVNRVPAPVNQAPERITRTRPQSPPAAIEPQRTDRGDRQVATAREATPRSSFQELAEKHQEEKSSQDRSHQNRWGNTDRSDWRRNFR